MAEGTSSVVLYICGEGGDAEVLVMICREE